MKTVLCVPGHDLKKVEGCRRYGADLILFDLEDSVPEGKKELAREIVAAHITVDDAVRINDLRSRWAKNDMLAMEHVTVSSPYSSPPLFASVWIPKLTRWDDIAACTARHVTVVVETVKLLQVLNRLTHPCPLGPFVLDGLAFGAADFAAYMNVPMSVHMNSPQVDYARQQVALAAAALGVPAYDSPFVNLRPDSLGSLRKSAHEALVLGYQWKGVVHPAQIPIVRDMKYEALFDEMLIRDYDRERGEDAVALVDGHVVAPPMIRAARKRLEEKS